MTMGTMILFPVKSLLLLLCVALPSQHAWQSPTTRTTFVKDRSTRLYAASPAAAGSMKQPMIVPPHLRDMRVATSVRYENDITLEKISEKPPIFILRNVLSEEECQELISSTCEFERGRTVSLDRGNNDRDSAIKRKHSFVGWVDNDVDSLARTVAERAHDILMPHQIFHPTRGVEPLQLVRYAEGGEYVLHHDSKNRLLTVLYYLNGSGETWFPLADSLEASPESRLEALHYCKELQPGKDGVLVSCDGRGTPVKQGDAVAFFNYFTDGTSDWRAIHAGLPVTTTKWIANHWYYYVPYGVALDENGNPP